MQKTFLISFLFLFSLGLYAQSPGASILTGKWKGEWSNDKGHYFTFTLDLKGMPNDSISGAFTWTIVKSPWEEEQAKLGKTAIEYFKGTYSRDTREVTFIGYKKDDPHLIIGIDTYRLTLSENNNILEGITKNHGTWKGVFYGSRILEKKTVKLPPVKADTTSELMGRKVSTKATVKASKHEVTIRFWDHQAEDGDIISLNLNGKWVLKEQMVYKKPQEITIQLDKGDNYLVLHAENLGTSPPNTAAISIIEDGEVIENLVLRSDMGASEAVKLTR